MRNRRVAPLLLSASEDEALRALVRAGTTEQRTATRARVILRASAGTGNAAIADELSISPTTVLLWRRRFAKDRLAGLGDAPRSGRPLVYGREVRDRIIALTLSPPPEGTTHWSARRLAERTGISITTIQRIWAEAALKPHRTETFKFSTDPDLAAKIRDVVGLYLNPPTRAIVLSVDEKTQIQALDRTAPMLPMKPGQIERHSHDYKRNGTTSLFAALEVATGKVTNQAAARHRHEEFLDFLNLLVRTYPRRQIHVVLDNVSSHKTPEVQQWLRRHKRFHFHFTPTSASWMNQIETWFGILTRQAIRRGTFDSVKALVAMIEAFTRSWNDGASPFMWVKTADEILAKAVRKPRVTSESGH